VLAEMSGGVDGVVLDPLGRPSGGVSVMLFPYGEISSRGDGGFSFNDIPLGGISESGDRRLVAHYGDGLQGGKVGWFGAG
jgi:hypothetical protein